MYLELNDELRKVKQDIKEKERIEKKIAGTKELINEYETELNIATNSLKKEEIDVKKLEGISLSSFIALILHNKEEKLDKERSEYIKAKIKYDECRKKLEDINTDLATLEDKFDTLRGANERYKTLISEKRQYIKKLGNIYSIENLDKLEDSRIDILVNIKEVKEAVEAGERLIMCIDDAEETLSSAKSWGTADIFMDSMFVSMAKHDKIDEAQQKLNKIPYLVDKFKKELSDISVEAQDISNKITFSPITKTFDIFFDNIFTDMSVQSKIEESYNSVRAIGRYVDECIIDLRRKKDMLGYRLQELDNEINQFIENED